jgi:hypothetical protein
VFEDISENWNRSAIGKGKITRRPAMDISLVAKMKYLIESYSKLFTSRGGLSDFIIYDADIQLRNQLNEKYNDEVKRVWNIMKEYI